MRILKRQVGLLFAIAAACAFTTQAGGATFGIVAHEPRLVWTAKGSYVQRPFPISYRELGREDYRVELTLDRDRFYLDDVNPDHVLVEIDYDRPELGARMVRFTRVLYEDLPNIELYALATNAGVANDFYHYFLREGDRFHHLGHFATLLYDPESQVFRSSERFGPGEYGSSTYRLHEGGRNLVVQVTGAAARTGWTCSMEDYAENTIRGECSARGRFMASGEETELRISRGYGLEAHVAIELHDATGRSASVLCYEGYGERESCPEREEGVARLRPYGFFWDFGDVVYLPGICRDRVSGWDNLVFRGQSGETKAIAYYLVFSFDPESRELRLEHVRSDSSYATGPAVGFAEWGDCNWRESKNAESAIDEAMSRLLVRDRRETPDKADSWEMPVREVPGHVVRDVLLALSEGTAWNFMTFLEASYSSAKDREAWRVIQVQTWGGYCEEVPGVVLVHDRRRDRWWSVYDTRFDCREAYALDDMVVSDDILFAWMCRTCRWGATPELTDVAQLTDVARVELSSLSEGDGKGVRVSTIGRDEVPALFVDATRNHLRHDMIRRFVGGE